MIGKGEKLEGLYVLNSLSLGHDCALEQFSVPSSICINTIIAQIWHNRLGHPSYQKLDVLIIKPYLDHLKSHYTDTCYVCPLAKQRRIPFISHNHLSPFPFDLVHYDIWGPFYVSAHCHYRFFVTLVDDCTRYTWIYLIKHKST